MVGQMINFQPAVPCPHCGFTNRPAISGWGGRYNTRTKVCKSCEKEYTLIVYAESSLDKNVSSEVSSLRSRVDHYKRRIYRLRNKLFNHSEEWAIECLRQEANSRGQMN